MNGICEHAWQSICNIAFTFLVHAPVSYEYLSFAFEHAWKVHTSLPIKNLLKNDTLVSPYEYFFGQKPHICRFRVLYCPCAVNIDQQHDVVEGIQLNHRNNHERGI